MPIDTRKHIRYARLTTHSDGRGPAAWATAVAALFLASCAHSPDLQHERSDIAIPDAFIESTAEDAVDEWNWDFGEPMLRSLVEEALANNYDLKAAAARLEAAEAARRSTGAAQFPSLNGNAGASVRNTFIEQPGGGFDERTIENYNLGLSLAWEIDVWGKVRNRASAAIADFEAEQEVYRAAQFSLAASTLRSWFNAVESELQLELANETLRVFEQNLSVVEGSYKRGLPDRALDVRLTRANVEAARQNMEFRRRNRDASGRSLEVLLGRYPADSIAIQSELPTVTGHIPAGLPSELLGRRPDINAAERRLAASLERARAARKDMLPTISLTSSAGTSTDELRDLLDLEQILWSIAGNLSQPIFQGGRLIAGVDLADANSRQLLAAYSQTVLNAFREVETLLAAEDYLAREQAAAEQAATESIAAEALAWQQYQRGLVDIVTVLESQRRAFNTRSSLLGVVNNRLTNRVNLHLALGGDFGSASTETEDSRVAFKQ